MLTRDAVREKVQHLLVEGMELQPVLLKGGMMRVEFGEEAPSVLISFEDMGAGGDRQRTVVETSSVILRAVDPSPELFMWAATEGAQYLIGHTRVILGEDPDGKAMLVYESRVLGDFLDEEELEVSFNATWIIASELSEALQPRFGGKRWNEEE